MELHCPDCGSIVYSRRSRLCGVCGAELPESFRFSPGEAREYEQTLGKAKASLKHAVEENLIIERDVGRRQAQG